MTSSVPSGMRNLNSISRCEVALLTRSPAHSRACSCWRSGTPEDQQRRAGLIGQPAVPLAVDIEIPGRRSLVERKIEEFVDLGDVLGIGKADQSFHSAVEVAVHQIGRTDPHGVVAAVGEAVGPRMLEEAPEDAADSVVSLIPGIPGRSEQIPRTHISTGTPAREAR